MPVRQVVGVTRDPAVVGIERREASLQPEVGGINNRGVPRRGIVNRLRKRVRAQETQPLGEALLEADLKGVISR